jgi:hypothetical protein
MNSRLTSDGRGNQTQEFDMQFSRRKFLETTASGALFGLGNVAFLDRLASVRADDAQVHPSTVRFRPEIEPLVRLVEETSQETLLEEIAARIKKGLSYREVVTALLLAGVRNVQPRPYVGFKFHSVLVVNAAHLASLSSPEQHRWLPIFWALDYFKHTQTQDVHEGDWTMAAVDEHSVPPAHRARQEFIEAMDGWDESRADVAATALARCAGAHEVFELLFRLGARDFRSIGHKAIYVANSWRALGCIGWHHAEPVIRSLTYALLNHRGSSNPSTVDDEADRPWKHNLELAKKIKQSPSRRRLDAGVTKDLVGVLRVGSERDAAEKVAELLNRNIAPQSIWDALFEAAAELVMRKPGILALHAATTTNALHFAYKTVGDENTRLLLMLQNASFMPLFRQGAIDRGGELDAGTIETLTPQSLEDKGAAGVEEIFANLSTDRGTATRKALAFLKGGSRARELIDAARVLIFLKGDDAHDYKFSSAVLEDYYHLSPAVRDVYLASSLSLLTGSGKADNGLVQRTRAAFASG